MRGRNWQALTIAGLTAFAVACGGDQAADDSGGMAEDAPAEQAMEQSMESMDPGEGMEQEPQLPEGVTMEMVNQGRTLFTGAGGCLACHGPQATGTQLAPDLTDGEWINISGRNYDEVVSLIKSGVPQPEQHPGPMPPMGGANLTDDQVKALSAYIVSLGG